MPSAAILFSPGVIGGGTVTTNVAASANGGHATASSTYDARFDPAGGINGDRIGLNWGNIPSGGWSDGTPSTFDDWFQVDFSTSYTINEIDLFFTQDDYDHPIPPTFGMVGTLYVASDFDIQYWNGSAWATVTGGSVTGNNLIWRKFTFSPVTTTKIRILIHGSQDGVFSRVVEMEAWTAPGTLSVSAGLSVGSSTAVAAGYSFSIAARTAGVIEMEHAGRGNGWTINVDVLMEKGISFHRGLPGSEILDLVAGAGALNFTLDNSESGGSIGRYSPDHINCFPWFKRNIGIRYRIGTQIRFTGTLDVIEPAPGTHGPRTVNCEVVDWWEWAARIRLSNLPVLVNKRADEVFQVLIDSTPTALQPPGLAIDTSRDVLPYTLDRTRDEQTMLRDEIFRLSASTLDLAWQKGDGTVVYENRTKRPNTTVAIDTYSDHHGFTATRDNKSIVNKATVTVHPRLPSVVQKVMYRLDHTLEIAAGAAPLVVLGPWTDPENPSVRIGAVSLTSLVSGTDFVANTQADGLGTDLTSSLTVSTGLSGNATEFTISLAGGLSGFITVLQQRGYPLYDYGESILPWENAESIVENGLSALQLDMPYQASPALGLGVAQYIVFMGTRQATSVSPFRRVVDMNNGFDLSRSIQREISDRIIFQDSVTGINRPFYINAISETERDGVLITEFTLIPAITTDFWLLGVAGRDELGIETRLGFSLLK